MSAPADPATWARLEDLLWRALELEPEAREAWIAAECADSPELREELESLLAAHEGPELALENRLSDDPATDPLIGADLGPYRLVERLGEGGMGEVYRAERRDDYEQDVAIKLVRSWFLAPAVVERFRLERQILARLEHPGIARILDGGVTEDGRPYLVMERVRGEKITDWCDRRQAPLDQRLRLFRDVCGIVHFAHRNLVVHRDLKPSNILVTEDGDVKLLDFGIAKLLDPSIDVPVQTRTDLRLFTPEYASPEQLLGESITTATDVHALGILLVELLAGQRPFSTVEANRVELESAICRAEATLPSRAITGPNGDERARARALPAVRTLRRRLRGDLDAIADRALRKSPLERYASAERLAEDVDRWLAGEPVSARQGARLYRLRKLASRHPWRLASAAAALVATLVFLTVLGLQARDLARERDRAATERDTAETVVELLTGLFAPADPTESPLGRDTPIGEILDREGERLVSDLESQPVVQARMRRVLAGIHRSYSDLDRAERLLDAAIDQQLELAGELDPEAVEMLHERATLRAMTGSTEQAVDDLRASLVRHPGAFGPDDLRTAQAMQDLAVHLDPRSDETGELLKRSLEIRRRAQDDETTEIAASAAALAFLHFRRDEFDDASELWEQASAIVERLHGPDHPFALTLLVNRAAVAGRRGQFDRAVDLHRRGLDARRRIFGERSLQAANSWNNLGVALVEMGDAVEGETALRESEELFAELLGPDHAEVANAQRNVALTLDRQGRETEALQWMERALDTARRAEQPRANLLYLESQIWPIRGRRGRTEEAAARLEEIRDVLRGFHPDGSYTVADVESSLGEALLALGQTARAEESLASALAYRLSYLPPNHPSIAASRCGLGRALVAQGDLAGALESFDACLPVLEEHGHRDLDAMHAAASRARAATSGG